MWDLVSDVLKINLQVQVISHSLSFSLLTIHIVAAFLDAPLRIKLVRAC